MALQVLLWAAVGLIAYCYFAYPLVLWVWSSLERAGGQRTSRESSGSGEWGRGLTFSGPLPKVSLIIAAYREEQVILGRIQNALMMDYPADRLEILIGCDGDEDATGDLVRTVDDSRVRLLQFPQRRGKPSVLNDCVAAAGGEILAFSDANTCWKRDALKRLVRHFQDERIGGVCGQLLLTDPETGGNVDGWYWRYENLLKRLEGRLGTLLGVNGAIYALRRELWEPLPPNSIVDDFLIGMRIHLGAAESRRRLIFEEQAVANEESAPTMQAEFHRRARIGAGGFQSLAWLLPLLNPLRGRVALAFWSHKVLRWLCPLFLLTALATNGLLAAGFGAGAGARGAYQVLLGGQALFYGTALLGRIVPGNGLGVRLMRLSWLFVGMNLALAVGFWRWLGNRQSGAWKRTARSAEVPQAESGARSG